MATIQELESFKLSDAVKFHKELNPQLWQDEKLDPEVRDQLMLIAEDFVEYLGLDNLKVEDVTISGSNAAYSYTPHSDLDLHVLVDFSKLPNDPVYQELFTAKKTLYNDAHDISVHGVPVELYVQDTANPVQSLGEYSIVHDKWIRIPKKRRANFDEAATKAKYEKLGDLIELALKSKDPKRVKDTIDLVKRYRKSGLDKHGEFGPENLAYKAVRKQGLVQALYDLKSELHGEKLSIEEDVGSIADSIKSRLGLKQFVVTERGDDLIVDSIIVGNENQGKGLGTTAMKELIDYADQNGKRIILTPGLQNKTHGTTSRNRLVKFYKSLGFKENKGRSIDFAMGAGKMYREPKLKETLLDKPEMTVAELAAKHGVSKLEIAKQLDKGIKVELEHTSKREVAREIALNHLEEDPKYYDKLLKANLEEDQLDETAEENQIVNVVSNIAAAEIAKVMKAKENKLLKLLNALGGETNPKDKLELFGVKVKDLNVPNVNNPLLKKLFSILYIKVKSRVYFHDDPSAPRTLGGYYDGDYTIELFFPALEYVAGKRETQLKSEIASTLAHEIQHAIDDYKSENAVYSGSNISPAKDMQGYLKLPYEVNARFQEATMDIAKYIAMPKKDGSKTTQADLPELIRYAFHKNSLDKIYEKNQKEYKRLLTRAYKFFQAELNSPKKATPIPQNIAKRALNWILGKQTKEINEESSYILSKKATLKSTASQIYMCEGIHYSKDMLLEQKLYEDFMGSAKQFLGAKFNTTMANIKGQVNDTINAGIIIKDVASNPELMNNVTAQLRKWTSQLVKEITRSMQGIGEKLNVPQLMDKLISAWKFISQKITEFGSSPGWKGFLGSLGIYGFVKFISDMLNNLTTLKSTIASGALDALVDKAKDLGQTIVGNITLPGFLGIFDKLTTVKKYFLDVLNKVKEKFSAFTVAGSPQFFKGVQFESSGYIPSEKEKNDPRFKTALTVDVKPDSIKKNAKAFSWKTSRAGIPPQARADGKITEALISYTPDKKFVNEKEEIQYVATTVKDWRIRARIFETIASRNINESTNNYQTIRDRVMKSLVAFSTNKLKIGNSYIPIQINILRDSLLFYDVKGNSPAQEPAEFGTLVELSNDEAKIRINNKLYNYPIHIDSANLMMVTVFLDSAEKYDQLRMMVSLEFEQSLPPLKPTAGDTVTERLMNEWKSFLAEDEQQELFPGYDKKHRQERLNAWLGKSHAMAGKKPKVLYHATTKDFDQFRVQNQGWVSGSLIGNVQIDRTGIFLAENPKFAEEFIKNTGSGPEWKENAVIIPVYLSAQYPFSLLDNSLLPMLRDEALVEKFDEHGIDLKSIYHHYYEDKRWELFDGPEGQDFVQNLKTLGYDSAVMQEEAHSHDGSETVWIAFSPNQVKAITNRGSFSPDDPRMMREDQKNIVPLIGYHVTATKNLPIIKKNGIKADKRGNSYIWDSREMAEWFMDFQNDEGQDRTILKIDMSGLDAQPDPEAEDMSEWSSRFKPGTNGGAWIISGPIPPNKIIG